MLNSFALDSFVLPQDNIELAVELAVIVPTAFSPTCTIFTTCPSSTDRGTTTTSPLAAGVESPWNLTLPGGAKDPADHALSNAGFGNSVSPIPALADVVPQIEGASAGMPFIASPSIFTDGSCDDRRTSPPSWVVQPVPLTCTFASRWPVQRGGTGSPILAGALADARRSRGRANLGQNALFANPSRRLHVGTSRIDDSPPAPACAPCNSIQNRHVVRLLNRSWRGATAIPK